MLKNLDNYYIRNDKINKMEQVFVQKEVFHILYTYTYLTFFYYLLQKCKRRTNTTSVSNELLICMSVYFRGRFSCMSHGL